MPPCIFCKDASFLGTYDGLRHLLPGWTKILWVQEWLCCWLVQLLKVVPLLNRTQFLFLRPPQPLFLLWCFGLGTVSCFGFGSGIWDQICNQWGLFFMGRLSWQRLLLLNWIVAIGRTRDIGWCDWIKFLQGLVLLGTLVGWFLWGLFQQHLLDWSIYGVQWYKLVGIL